MNSRQEFGISWRTKEPLIKYATGALLFLLWAPTHHAFELSGNFWEFAQATFHVGISGTSPSGTTWNEAFIRSMDAWTHATDFEFLLVNEFLDPCIDQGGPNDFGDNMAGVDFRDTVCGMEFGDNALAVTLTAGVCLNQECTGGFKITDADIVFNNNEPWDVYAGPLRFDNTADFQRVALHELGHVLGMTHVSEDIEAIMQPFASEIDSLQADDIAGANFLYGAGATLGTIYGIDISLPTNSELSGPDDTVNFSGSLSNPDADLDGRLLDIYQFTFTNDSSVDIQLNSSTFDPFLYLVRVSSTQDTIDAFTFVDNDSGPGRNSRISANIKAGPYWLGASSAGVGEVGDYDVSMVTSTNSTTPSFETFESIYGAEVQVNPNPKIKGSLSSTDFLFAESFLDLYQFDVVNTTNLRFDLSSSQLDTYLRVVEILPDQPVGSLVLENDNRSESTTDSRIQQSLPPGTYWIGVSSSSADETGDYSLDITVIIP